MKKLLGCMVLLLFAIATPADSQNDPLGRCPVDQNGYVTCGAYCNVSHQCVTDASLPPGSYCYTYLMPPGCYHDGEGEPCCMPSGF